MRPQKTVAICLADPVRTEELGKLLTGEDFAPVFAQSSDELHQVLNGQCVDLLILENQLKGFLTGLQILEHLHKDLVRPPTILVGADSGDAKAKAAALQVSCILPAKTSASELADAVQKTLSSSVQKAPLFPINLEARRLVQASDSIQPLPQVLVKISGYLDRDASSISELAKDIAVDARLTAMLLRLVNSTAFGLRTKLTRVDEAVTYLGIRRTVSVVISAYLIGAQKGLASKLPEAFRMWHQRRSVLIACAASSFAKLCDGLSTETAYVLGLLQDLGMLVMAAGYGEPYIQLVERVKKVATLRLEVLEQDQFRVKHADVSAALLLKWELPASMIPPVLNHQPSTEPEQLSNVERRFLQVMRIGEALANVLDNSSPQRTLILNQYLTEGGFGTLDDCKSALAEAVAKTAESSQMFAIPSPDPGAMQAIIDKAASDMQAGGELTGMDLSTLADTPTEIMYRTAIAADAPLVVIIDNDAVESETVSRHLAEGGIRSIVCSTPAQARSHASEAAAVLFDFSLSSDSALDGVRKLRSDGFTRSIIMMSADRTRSVVIQAIEAGINGFLPKPFTKDLLLEKVSTSLLQSQGAKSSQ